MKKPSSIGISLFFICLIAVGMLLLGACSGDGENATISIKIGNEPGKAAIGLDQLKHTITLSGPTGTKTLSIKGAGTAKATVVPGFWDISVTAYFGDELYAVGSSSAEVKAGRNTDVQIQMTVVWTDTAGTPSSPAQTFIEIWTIDDLLNVSNGMGKNYKLMADIVLSTNPPTQPLKVPLGTVLAPFTGIFDGQGFTIELLMTLTGTLPECAGLFAAIGSTGTVKNLKLSGNIGELGTGDYYAGAVAGKNSGTIEGVESSVDINISTSSGYVIAGGIVGENENGGSITNCRYNGYVDAISTSSFVTDNANAGGIAGVSSGNIKGCHNYADILATAINSSANAGGITSMTDGTIENCSNTSATQILATSFNSHASAGGIVGSPGPGGVIKNCLNSVDIKAEGNTSLDSVNAGGIAGGNQNVITNCYSTGDVTADNSSGVDYAGGIVGNGNYPSSQISYCWAEGVIIRNSTSGGTGGIAGRSDGSIKNCVALNDKLNALSGWLNTRRIWGDGTGSGLNNWGNFAMDDGNSSPGIWTPDPILQDGDHTFLATASTTAFWYSSGADWTLHIIDPASDSSPWVWDTTALRPKLYFEL